MLIGLIVFGPGPHSFAQQQDENKQEDFFEMSLEELMEVPIVVTAARIKQPISKAPATVTVITEEEIRNMGAQYLWEVLETVPGFGTILNYFGVMKYEVRGFQSEWSEKVLVILNGHPIDNELLNGGATIVYDNLPVDNIKRIEIIRGPASALYGGNAFLGLINIITKDPNDIDGIELSHRMGSFDTKQYNLQYGKVIDDFGVALNLNHLDTDGFDAYVGRDASGSSGLANSWQNIHDLSLQLDYQKLQFKGNYRQRKTGPFFGGSKIIDISDATNSYYRNYFLEIEYDHAVSDNLDTTTRIYHDYNYFHNLFRFTVGGSLFDYWHTVNRSGGEVLGKYILNEQNRITAGLTLEKHKIFDVGWSLDGVDMSDPSTNWNGDHDRTVWALYVEDIWNIRNNLQLNIGGRYDHYSDFGGIFNPRGGIVWEFAKDYHLKFLYGKGFRAPTFGEMYNINNPFLVGNPDIKPEKVTTYEVALDGKIAPNISSRISAFHNTLTDVIGIYNFQHENLSGKTKTLGLETELKAFYAKDSYIAMNYTYQETEDNDGGDLPDAPRHKGNILVSHRLAENINLLGHVLLKGKSERAAGDVRDDVSGYPVVNIGLLARDFFIKGLDLQFSVKNLFDKKCFDPSTAPSPTQDTYMSDYQRPERSFWLKMVYKF